MTDQETAAHALLDQWIDAVGRRDVAAVSALYHPQAQFWGTLASHLREDPAGVADYFRHFLARHRMDASIGQLHLRGQGDLVLAAGHYRFIWQDDRDSEPVKARARFTFVLGRADGQWRILQHHSSAWVLSGF